MPDRNVNKSVVRTDQLSSHLSKSLWLGNLWLGDIS